MNTISSFIVPVLLASVAVYGLHKKVDVFSALTDGAESGLHVVLKIFPNLVALLTAVSMLRASGALDAAASFFAPLLTRLGVPPGTVSLMFIRPISGSGAIAAAEDIIKISGADSITGRTAAVMLGSTETTFYTIAVYFGAVGITKSRYAIPAAICADIAGFITAALTVHLFWG